MCSPGSKLVHNIVVDLGHSDLDFYMQEHRQWTDDRQTDR